MNSSIFKLLLCVISVAIFACGGGDSSVRDSARESIGGNQPTLSAPTTNPATMTASAPGGSVMHYICPKNCEGSGGAGAGTCPVCGSEYIHNQAFHAAQSAPTTEGGTTTATFQGGTGATPTPDPTSITPPTPEPAQNAAGVWHYTCAKGCAGGAGSAVACATCGATLTHNTAYHQ